MTPFSIAAAIGVLNRGIGITLTFEDGSQSNASAFRGTENQANGFFTYLNKETCERTIKEMIAFEHDDSNAVISTYSRFID